MMRGNSGDANASHVVNALCTAQGGVCFLQIMQSSMEGLTFLYTDIG